MNPQEKILLEKTHELAEENNKILHSLRRSNRLGSFFRLLYWIIIIGVSIGAYYYVEPYVNTILTTYKGIQGDIDSVKSVTNGVLNKLK